MDQTSAFLDILGIDEFPMGIFYTDRPPSDGLTPNPGELPTREREQAGDIDWQAVFDNFSCVIGHIWRARRKHTTAWFSPERFGCAGGAFFLGYMKPQSETIIHYVSSGVPGRMEGEHYCESPDELRRLFEVIDPPQAAAPYCVVKPLDLFDDDEAPEIVAFFARPECIAGLHQLSLFITNDPEAVASPWGAACTNLITWPRHYMRKGKQRAVLGGWDPSARKFFKTDELSFSVPYAMYRQMLDKWDQSFLTTKTWKTVRKKIDRSRRVWGDP